MKFIIWGAGARGKRLLQNLGQERIEAFLDMNPEKRQDTYCGKRVIGFEEYEKTYPDTILIVSFVEVKEGVEWLQDRGIDKYLLLTDCPYEIQGGVGKVSMLKEHIQKSLKPNCRYGVYGHSLYGFLVYEWAREWGCKNVFLIDDGNMSKGIMNALQAENYHYISSEEISENHIEHILNCKNVVDKKLADGELVNIPRWDLFDCLSEQGVYKNDKIKMFKNLHEGKKCFIVATGPSLRIEDLDTLKRNQAICFSVNFIGNAFADTSWRPTYYMAADAYFIEHHEDHINNMEAEYMFVADGYEDFWKNPRDSRQIRWHNDNCTWSFSGAPRFSKNCEKIIYAGVNITYCCLQLAAYMGFKEIYLLGVDFCFTNKRHFYKADEIDNRPLQSYLNDLDGYRLEAYKEAQKYAEENGIKIYNATRGGMLEVFERVDFDSLF